VVYDPSGKQITIDEGPFFIWDACAACSGAAHIDMSGERPSFCSYFMASQD